MNTGKTLLSIPLFFSVSQAFSFGHSAPTQCDQFTVQWSGGTPPFSLLITPVFDNPRNFSIPSTASGSYSLQLPLNAGQQFIVTISDATGFASGGVSDLLTVGGSVSGASCNTQVPTTDFQFQLNDLLQQCGQYSVSGYDGAQQPVTITGLIPLGQPIQLHPSPGPSSFTWDPVNVPTGTSIIFFVTDAASRFGGSSHVTQVGSSSKSDCINDQSPHSTASADSTIGPAPIHTPVQTSTIKSSTTGIGTPTDIPTKSPSSRIGGSTIAGVVIGAMVALLVVGSLLAFWFKQYRDRRRASWHPTSHRGDGGGGSGSASGDFLRSDLADPLNSYPYGGSQPSTPWTTFPSTSGTDYIAEPWMYRPGPNTGASMSAPMRYPYPTTANVWSESQAEYSTPTPTRATKTPPAQRPTRLVLHTDAEEVIEMPPHYSATGGSASHAHPPPS